VSWFLFAIGTGLAIVAGSVDSEALGAMALILHLTAVFLGFSQGILVSTKRVNAQYIWMRGICKDYRESLPEFPEVR
jgi:Na+-driven multidrug efflux pump